MDDESELSEAVDDAMAPVVDELWAPIREQLGDLYAELGLARPPWRIEELVALVRKRASRQP